MGTALPVEDVSFSICDAAALGEPGRDEVIQFCSAAYAEDFSRLFDWLPLSTHVLVRDPDGHLVSHAAWVERLLETDGTTLNTAYVEAVATAASHRARGLASAVVRRLAKEVGSRGYELAALSPSDPNFYTRLGWETWTGPLGIRQHGTVTPTPRKESVMILRFPATPKQLVTSGLLTAEWRYGDLW